jgi:opacity protein-like surface antigen
MRYLMMVAAATVLPALGSTGAALAQAPAKRSVKAPPAPVADVTANDRPTGFMLGIHSVGVTGLEIGGGDSQNGAFNTTFGAGAGLTLGWAFNRTFSLYSSIDVAKQKTAPSDTPDGSWGLVHMAIGGRANLPLGGSTMPYITAGLGGRALAAKATFEEGPTVNASISGKFLSVGGGIERPLSRSVALDGGVDVAFGRFSHFKAGDDEWDENVNLTKSIRMRLGITWRPGARRTT